MTTFNVVYGVPWIEVEFGSRDEDMKLYKTLKEAQEGARKDSNKGAYDGGYIGPERPERVIEILRDELDPQLLTWLDEGKNPFTDNNWHPRFKGRRFGLNDKEG